MKTTPTTNQLKSPEKLGNKQETIRNKKGQFVKGISGNPEGKGAGRPLGSKDFKTLMDEAVKEIAAKNKISTAEVWQVLIKRGYSEAKDGNYPFYKDLLDRYYGKPKEFLEHSGEIEFIELDDKKYRNIARREAGLH